MDTVVMELELFELKLNVWNVLGLECLEFDVYINF